MKQAEQLLNYLQCYLPQLNLDGDIDVAKVVTYLELLEQWNNRYNLTAITSPQDMVVKHIMDSLSIYPYINGTHIIDVGSGAGLPGIPLALLMRERHFTLLDSNIKKTVFLHHVIQQLSLTNVSVVHSRVESYQPEAGFDTILTRAFSSLPDMIRLTQHLCRKGGTFVAMKGQVPEPELTQMATEYPNCRVESIAVPGLNAERHCIIIEASCGTLRE